LIDRLINCPWPYILRPVRVLCVWSGEQAVRASQQQRQALMTEMCKIYFPPSNDTTRQEYPIMLSSDKQQYLYCSVPKVKYQLPLYFLH